MVSSQMIEVWKLSEKQDKHTTNDKQTMDLMHSGNSIDSRGRVGGGAYSNGFSRWLGRPIFAYISYEQLPETVGNMRLVLKSKSNSKYHTTLIESKCLKN